MFINNKFKIQFLILLFFFSSTSLVYGQNGYTLFSFFYNGNQYSSGFQHTELKNTPSWNLEKDEAIPLSVQKAIEIARENLKSYLVITDDRWKVGSIYLKQVYKDKWVYSIQFYCSSQQCVSDTNHFSIHLKMDGSIIEPKIKPIEFKISSVVDFSKPLDLSFDYGSNQYKIKVSENDLKDTVSWNPEKEIAAPLSFQKAVRTGREKLNGLTLTANNWVLNEISFRPMGKDKWLYKNSFECRQEIKNCGFFYVYIKADGSVVEPTITPKIK